MELEQNISYTPMVAFPTEFNHEKNIARVSLKIDGDDNNNSIFDVTMASTTIYRKNDTQNHRILVFFPEDLKKYIILNPEDTPVGTSIIHPIFGFPLDSVQFQKLPGSIGNASYGTNADAGSQYEDELDAFIPAGFNPTHINNEKEPDPEEDIRTCGIGLGKDGSIILRGTGGEIVIGEKIRITGPVTYADAYAEQSDIFMPNPLSFLPSLIVFPMPEKLPNINTIISIANLTNSVIEIGTALS